MDYQPIPSPSSGPVGFFVNSPFGDTTFTKVFVGGLAWETHSDTLRQHFEKFGDILEAVVISDKNTGRSKGYGFVTFREPEGARRACVDPTPIIDGRRANCNLASLGRPRPSLPFGRFRPTAPHLGGLQSPRGAYGGNYPYQQPFPYNYQQGYVYPPYGYTAYGQEYVYPQGVYHPYTGQQYVQVYGNPVNPNVYPYGQLAQSVPGGSHGYTAMQGYAVAGHQIVPFGSPGVPNSPSPTAQGSYPTAAQQFRVHAPTAGHFLQGGSGGSDHASG